MCCHFLGAEQGGIRNGRSLQKRAYSYSVPAGLSVFSRWSAAWSYLAAATEACVYLGDEFFHKGQHIKPTDD